jgi:hypothetical protein
MPRVPHGFWTPAQILGAMRDFYDAYGVMPHARHFCAVNALPSTRTVHRVFGSLSEARLVLAPLTQYHACLSSVSVTL